MSVVCWWFGKLNSSNPVFIKRSGVNILFNYLDTSWSKQKNPADEKRVNFKTVETFFRTVLWKPLRKCNRIAIILLVIFYKQSWPAGLATNVQRCERKEGDICGEILSSSAAIASRVADCTRPRRFKTVGCFSVTTCSNTVTLLPQMIGRWFAYILSTTILLFLHQLSSLIQFYVRFL